MYKGKVINYYTNKPIQNIQVSNGTDITYTDANGCFSLPQSENVHVINVNMLTKCHDDWYINIDSHQGDFNFRVKPVEEREEFSFLHISDTEIEGRDNNNWIDFVKNTVKEEKPMFFINTGDLCREDGLKRSYLLMNSENTGCTVRYALGNHDMCEGYGEKIYEKYYGPTWYSFNLGKIHFIVLNLGVGDNESGYTKNERYCWLKKDIECTDKDMGIVILGHYFYPECKSNEQTEEEIIELCEGRMLKALIFGHMHSNFVCEDKSFIKICSNRPDSGGIDSTPAGIRKINISGTDISTECIYNAAKKHTAPDKCIWETKLNGNIEFSSVLKVDDAIWVCTNDDGYPKKCGIYKLDALSGNILAHIPTNGIKSEFQISDGKLYAQDSCGILYCVDTKNATLLWKTESDISGYYTRSGIIIIENKVIAGHPSNIQAYNKDSGKLLWTNKKNCLETPARYVYDESRNQLIVVRQWLGIYSINPDTGEDIWTNTESGICTFNSSTPLIIDNTILKTGYTLGGLIDAKNGEFIKTNDFKIRFDVSGSSVADDKFIYIPTATSGVIGISRKTFSHELTFLCEDAMIFTPPYVFSNFKTVETTPQIIGNKLIFAASDGYLYIYNKHTSELHKKINIGSPVLATPYIFDDYIVVADFNGNIKKYRIL